MGGQFKPKLGGHFELKTGGQYARNLQVIIKEIFGDVINQYRLFL